MAAPSSSNDGASGRPRLSTVAGSWLLSTPQKCTTFVELTRIMIGTMIQEYRISGRESVRSSKKKVGNRMSSVRILVVDDYEPFRRFICSTLEHRLGFQVIGDASDGLEAVQKAEGLQPDLIILDLGLPKLNGIEAARQIRTCSPASKILIVSQESSVDIAHEAFSAGALGYVVKTHAGNELVPASEAIMEGRQFISAGLLPCTNRAPGLGGLGCEKGIPSVATIDTA